ncbi:MAG: helicase [Deltaproteobacteria bacterium]|nr:helicase [Deltaproteobacteria bacterium]
MKPYSRAADYFIPEALTFIAREIEQTAGNEVFFIGFAQSSLVSEVRVVARGNGYSAPAILRDLRAGDVLIHNHPSGLLHPSDADIAVASLAGECGAAFYIIDNRAEKLYAVVPLFKGNTIKPLDGEEVISLLKAGSKLSSSLKAYEERSEQLDMASVVTSAFNDERIALIEAGTGIGKSMAYLVPSILWAVENRERIVISTNTINLQEQLIEKDIPLLQKSIDHDFKAVLIKGRGNYACKRKAFALSREGNYLFEDNNIAEEKSLLQWISKTKDGSRSDLNFIPKDSSWEKIVSETDVCRRSKCSFYNDCFFYQARREAASSDILVANHHLLFADLAVKSETGTHGESGVMPPYSRVIIDEAHNVEDVATEYFGAAVSKRGLSLTTGRLVSKKDSAKGLLPFIYLKMQKMKGHIAGTFLSATSSTIKGELIPHLAHIRELSDELFDMTAYWSLEVKKGNRENGDMPGEIKVRIKDPVTSAREWKHLENSASTLLTEGKICARKLRGIVRDFENLPHGDEREALDPQVLELKAYSERLKSFLTTVEAFFFHKVDGTVKWIETARRNGAMSVRLKISPISVAEAMSEKAYKVCKTIIFTSATLSVRKKFDYIKGRTGLDLAGERLTETLLESPFDYKRQAFVGIPADMPLPGEKSYVESLGNTISLALKASEGKAFVLFTSYRMLNDVYGRLAHSELLSPYRMMRQGDGPRSLLLDSFRKDKHSIIFGSDSFWEGVDVPGDALMNVILAKLPFSVPDDPLIEARAEMLEADGKNAFMSYFLPRAVIKFKQGFGRLIRNKRDRGAVLILDSRIVRKSYGNAFLSSLPDCNVQKLPAGDLVESLNRFFMDMEV